VGDEPGAAEREPGDHEVVEEAREACVLSSLGAEGGVGGAVVGGRDQEGEEDVGRERSDGVDEEGEGPYPGGFFV